MLPNCLAATEARSQGDVSWCTYYWHSWLLSLYPPNLLLNTSRAHSVNTSNWQTSLAPKTVKWLRGNYSKFRPPSLSTKSTILYYTKWRHSIKKGFTHCRIHSLHIIGSGWSVMLPEVVGHVSLYLHKAQTPEKKTMQKCYNMHSD